MDAPETRGFDAARWVGRGDEERGLSMLSVAAAGAYFVSLFLPWIASFSAWTLRTADDAGLLALAVVLLETLRLSGVWVARGASLTGFCLTAAAGVMGLATWATFRWGDGGSVTFASFAYGAWLGFALAILLVAVAARRLVFLIGSAT